jgi:hypothetical protein
MKIRIGLIIILIFICGSIAFSQVPFRIVHFVVGRVADAPGIPANGRTVYLYYPNSPEAFSTAKVGEISGVSNWYMIDVSSIPGITWAPGSTVEAKIEEYGYKGGPVAVITTSRGFDIAPEITMSTEGPIFSRVTFDGRGYYPNDVITDAPKISAHVTDPNGVDYTYFEINIGPDITVEYSDFDPTKGDLYKDGLVVYTVKPPKGPIPAGSYQIVLKAQDTLGNLGGWIGNIRVFGGAVKLVPNTAPLTFPIPFSPVTKKHPYTSITYNLTVDGNITIYMYDTSGQIIWTRKLIAGEEGGRAGYNEVRWNGITDFGGYAGNGIVVFKIVHGNRLIGQGKIVIYD